MKYEFVCEQQSDSEELGWRLLGRAGFLPVGGMAVAHDILEHTATEEMSTTAEVLALGALMYVRGAGYLIDHGEQDARPSTYFIWPLTDMVRRIRSGEFQAIKPRSVVASAPLDSDVATDIERAVALLHEGLKDSGSNHFPTFELSECEASDIRFWLVEGYRRAQERYATLDRQLLGELFWKIEQESTSLLRTAKLGQVMVVHVTLRTYSVTARIVEPQNADYPVH